MNDTKKAHPQHRLARIVVIGSLVILPVGLFAAPAFADTPTAVDHSATQGTYLVDVSHHDGDRDGNHGNQNWNNQDPGRWNQNNQWNQNQWNNQWNQNQGNQFNQWVAPNSNPFGFFGSL